MLSPEKLHEKYLMVLDAACRYLRQAPTEHLKLNQADRPTRTFRSLGIHAIQMAAAFLDSQETRRLERGWRKLPENAADLWTGEDIATYGEEIRKELKEWWPRAGARIDMDRIIENDWGVHTAHQSMERQTWHSAQHVRQLMMFLEQLGIEPDGRLSAKDLDGLPLPDNIWDT